MALHAAEIETVITRAKVRLGRSSVASYISLRRLRKMMRPVFSSATLRALARFIRPSTRGRLGQTSTFVTDGSERLSAVSNPFANADFTREDGGKPDAATCSQSVDRN
jgi:hypothetical protein